MNNNYDENKTENPAPTMVPKPTLGRVKGNILLFYAYDIGDFVNINAVKSSQLLEVDTPEPFPHFKNYHIPLTVEFKDDHREVRSDGRSFVSTRISAKIHNFGAITLCYRVTFTQTLEDLKKSLIVEVERHQELAHQDAKFLFDCIKEHVGEPWFYLLDNQYYAVQLDNKSLGLSANDLLKHYGSTITSLLRLETRAMSEYQKNEILASATGYYGSDLTIIDGEGAFIYDSEYMEILEFFELANLQRLELQNFDRMLDQKLNFFYSIDNFHIPWIFYVPLLGNRNDSHLVDLARLRVDVSVVAERLNNTINMSGDSYFEHLYNLLTRKMKIRHWEAAIKEKLSIINEIYTLRKNRLQIVREEMMAIIVIVLIAIEVVLAFLKAS